MEAATYKRRKFKSSSPLKTPDDNDVTLLKDDSIIYKKTTNSKTIDKEMETKTITTRKRESTGLDETQTAFSTHKNVFQEPSKKRLSRSNSRKATTPPSVTAEQQPIVPFVVIRPPSSTESQRNDDLVPKDAKIKAEIEIKLEACDICPVKIENLNDTHEEQPSPAPGRRKRQKKLPLSDDFVYNLKSLTRKVSPAKGDVLPEKPRRNPVKKINVKKGGQLPDSNLHKDTRRRIFVKMIKPAKGRMCNNNENKLTAGRKSNRNVHSVPNKEAIANGKLEKDDNETLETVGVSPVRNNDLAKRSKPNFISPVKPPIQSTSGSTDKVVKTEHNDSAAYKFTNPYQEIRHKKRKRNNFIEEDVCYIVVNNATQRGSKRLVGGNGYTYNLTRSKSTKNIYWRCSHRPHQGKVCRAVVSSQNNVYRRRYEHDHPPDPDAFIRCFVSAEVKKKSMTDFLMSPRQLIEKILMDHSELILSSDATFNVDYLIRSFNRNRCKIKRRNPILQDVTLTKSFPASFLVEDILFRRKRHMILATAKQLRILEKTDCWYVDLTNKFVKHPFTHLLSISAYMRDGIDAKNEEEIKLKPLIFVIMSSIEFPHFLKVFRSLLRHLRKPLLVRSFVLDFYPGLWRTIRHLFFNCKLHGCAWKFGQCIWTKVQTLDVEQTHTSLYDEIHKLLKLPFVPQKEILNTYELIKKAHLSMPAFESLDNYMEDLWLYNCNWRISNWCVYNRPFRTKVEVIGWHYVIHTQVKGRGFLESFVQELNDISLSIPLTAKPVHQHSVKTFYRNHVYTPQAKLYQLWEEEFFYDTFLTKCCMYSEPQMEGIMQKMFEQYAKIVDQ